MQGQSLVSQGQEHIGPLHRGGVVTTGAEGAVVHLGIVPTPGGLNFVAW